MTETTSAPPRIATLDIVRGVAVMGILAMNIVAYAMPRQAYMNPMAYGMEGSADLASWVFNFIVFDGKMRGLFSFLFGASLLLVIDRAGAAGQSAAETHFRRMAWLLVFGLLHFYFIWFGDILTAYAIFGMAAWFFRKCSVRALIGWGAAFLFLKLAIVSSIAASFYSMSSAAASPDASAETLRTWAAMQEGFGIPTGQQLADNLALYRGNFAGIAEHQLTDERFEPFVGLVIFGWETLGYILLGMAAFRSGFLTGQWAWESYRRVALIGFGIGIPVYAAMAAILIFRDFDTATLFALWMAATVPFRPLMIVATAALIILLTRRGGALVDRIAAAGQTAFTNYLGTSILMTGLFYGWGLGLYGTMSRVELWIVVLAMWALMLLWSKSWLDRYRYGPFEWLWRTLARGSVQPMRRPLAAA